MAPGIHFTYVEKNKNSRSMPQQMLRKEVIIVMTGKM